ncbi:MAG: UTP--GlnB [Chthonomonadaceae bacterium]|nr:UTP--GlnB [Chthonomonadaceae bacterium]
MSGFDDLVFALGGIPLVREKNPHIAPLAHLESSEDLADYLRRERHALLHPLKAAPPANGPMPVNGLALARRLTDLTDAMLIRLFTLACQRARVQPDAVPVAIVATGGYGRRELSPCSDIDITFIPQRDGDPVIDRLIREMFTQVMDICIARCGLEVGYAYRLFEDCTNLDHQTATGLLDARLLTGSNRLFIQFEDAFWMGFNPADFIFTKIEEREKALARWGTTPRVVEPQLKEGPGGLRDLQTAVWLAQARGQWAAARVRGERGFAVLAEEGQVSAADLKRLEAAKELLFQARGALHAVTGAERDELVITRQEDVANRLGYRMQEQGTDHIPPVEQFMADLFPAMALVRRVTDQVIRRVGNSRLMIGIGLDCKRREIVPANDSLESDDPVWLLWACELTQKYNLTLGEAVERAMVALVASRPIVKDPQQSGEVFTQILAHRGRAYPTLQRMADLGILGWFLPEFQAIFDLIPYDPSHDHTVGQHSLLVVRTLEALLQSTEPEEQVEMRRIYEELPNPEQLILAALLHDSGKAFHDRPHSEVSEEIVAVVCKRLGWSESATANVRFLCLQHLLMAETSRLRDLSLDETIREFTSVVDDIDRLNMLYLLTYADTRAVGSGVWTQVKGRFLRDLWRRSAAVLSDEEPVGYDEATVARARRRLLKDLSVHNLPEAEVAEHIHTMPPQYLLNQSLRDIALHIEFIRKLREGQPVIDFMDEPDATYTEMTVCTYDDPRPGLLAKIAGVLYAADVNIHSAQVVTRVQGEEHIALDTLWIDYHGRQLAPGKRREIVATLREVLSGAKTVPEILSRRKERTHRSRGPSYVPYVPLTIRSIRNDLSDTYTVVEAVGPDVPGTFYKVADSLSHLGWDIVSARVSAWRGEARCSFYVLGARGLRDAEAREMLGSVLPHTLAESEKSV